VRPSIEALSNDIDFRGMTSRAEFEKLSADLIDRAMIPVESLLEQVTKLNPNPLRCRYCACAHFRACVPCFACRPGKHRRMSMPWW
jgi:hypothetical protein